MQIHLPPGHDSLRQLEKKSHSSRKAGQATLLNRKLIICGHNCPEVF
jgi:hypothetical protein